MVSVAGKGSDDVEMLHDAIELALLCRYPGYCWGKVVVLGLDNRACPPAIAERLRRAEAALRSDVAFAEIVTHPAIAVWRAAFASCGARPSKYQSSIEALVRRVRRGDALPTINSLVDLCNAISLEYLLPVGGDDLERTIGALSLRFARGDEDYVALGEQTPAPPEAGEVIYADEATVLCRRWCWRQGERTKVTPDTRDAVLNVHGLPPAHRSTVESACNALAVAVPSLLGGVAASYVLDDAQPTHVADLRGLRSPGARPEA